MDIVSGSRRPLESHTIKHLCGIIVSGLYPAHGVFAAHVVGHQRTQQRNEVRILHHPLKSLLELFGLDTTQFEAGEGETHKDVGKELAMGVAGMEHDALLGCLGQ